MSNVSLQRFGEIWIVPVLLYIIQIYLLLCCRCYYNILTQNVMQHFIKIKKNNYNLYYFFYIIIIIRDRDLHETKYRSTARE